MTEPNVPDENTEARGTEVAALRGSASASRRRFLTRTAGVGALGAAL